MIHPTCPGSRRSILGHSQVPFPEEEHVEMHLSPELVGESEPVGHSDSISLKLFGKVRRWFWVAFACLGPGACMETTVELDLTLTLWFREHSGFWRSLCCPYLDELGYLGDGICLVKSFIQKLIPVFMKAGFEQVCTF